MYNSSQKKIKLLIFSNSPGPNQSDFFCEIAKHPNFYLDVWYMGRRYFKWNGTEPLPTYSHKFFANILPFAEKTQSFLNPGIIPQLFIKKYDYVIVQGYFMPSAVVAMIILGLLKRKWGFWGEMVDRSNSQLGWKFLSKKIILGRILNTASFILVIGGKIAEKSYIKFGYEPSKMFSVPYSCVLDPYLNLNSEHMNYFHLLKDKFKSKKERVIFSLAQLIPRKCIDLLIKVFIELEPIENNLRLLIGGDGDEKDNLVKLIPDHLRDKISFLNFVPKEIQPPYYYLADLFVLPSREDGWGMVVAESLASGTPVITTTGVMSAHELIKDGINGFVIEPNNADELTKAIEKGLELSKVVDRESIKLTSKTCSSKFVADKLNAILFNLPK